MIDPKELRKAEKYLSDVLRIKMKEWSLEPLCAKHHEAHDKQFNTEDIDYEDVTPKALPEPTKTEAE